MAFSATICDRWQIDSIASRKMCKHWDGNVKQADFFAFPTDCLCLCTYPGDAAAHDFPDRKVTKSSSIQAKKKVLGKIWLHQNIKDLVECPGYYCIYRYSNILAMITGYITFLLN